ncbi:hypothetical protein BD779DRAFT_1670856 [Infundibulicybe gibba]|nr:hypothetical protein BD779DRAFT_1670856 [Infundibulicybe gibba]
MSGLLEYQSLRSNLIQEDRSLRREFSRIRSRTELEVHADAIIRKIRAEEASSIWTVESESVQHPFPGMEFLTGRSIIEKTRLFEILGKMPKGALLHSHLDATVNAEFLLKLALAQPALHVRVTQPLSPGNLRGSMAVLPEFRALPQESFSDASSLTDHDYVPGTWVSMQRARGTFDPNLGGPEGFDKWTVGSMTIHPLEAYGTHNTISKIWDKFRNTFIVSTGLIRFAPIFPEYVREFLLSSIKDGIMYIEARVNFLYKHMIGADGQENIPHREWLIMFDRVLEEVKESMKQQGHSEFIGARAEAADRLPRATADFRERQKEVGVDIPFIFHAGETLGDGTAADMNLYDAILLGTKRIGHGFSLAKHPKLLELCRERGIAVEQIDSIAEMKYWHRLTSSMPMYPLPILMNNGVPVALCSDDPSVFGNMGLTYDFFQLTGLTTLGELARDSLEYSTLEGDEKVKAIAIWEKQWTNFWSM